MFLGRSAYTSATSIAALNIIDSMRDSEQAQLAPKPDLDSETDKEDAGNVSASHPETQPVTSPSRRDRLRARQSLPSSTHGQHNEHQSQSRSPHRRQTSPVLIGCVLAAALATVCLGRWFRRRKLKHKRQNVRHLLTKCKLEPSQAVQEALPPPPLLSNTFVTTAV